MSENNKKIIKVLIFALVGIGLNLIGRIIADNVSIPLWLDSVGTIVATYMGGPIAGIIAALVNLVYGIINSQALIYVVVSLIIAGAYIIVIYLGALERLSMAVLVSFPIAIISAIVSTPINMVLYDGSTGNVWGDTLRDMLTWRGMPAVVCAFSGEFALDLVDKQVCVLLAFLIIFLLKKKYEPLKIMKKVGLLVLAFVMAFAPAVALFDEKVDASVVELENTNSADSDISIVSRSTVYSSNYTSVIYDNSNGLMSAEANAVAETEDGVIWIGSYAGLTKYDGASFEFVSNPAVASVTTLFVDSRGVLWIGTNDGGLVSYDGVEYYSYTKAEGAPSNSVRSIIENTQTGDIYFGTTDKICKVTRTGRLKILDEVDASFTISLAEENGIIYAADYDGGLHIIEADEEVAYYNADQDIYCVESKDGAVYAAGAGSIIYRVNVSDDVVILKKEYETKLTDINYIGFDAKNQLWVCANDGLGYVADNGVFYVQHVEGFENQINYMHYDYQNNIWVTSARKGVVKLCENQFENLFISYDVPQSSVNAVVEYNDKFYCGTDTGLVILGEKEKEEQALIDALEGVRIRALVVDSANSLWLATYGDNALVKFDIKKKSMIVFNQETCELTSNNVRCVAELKDGTIVAGTTNGINFIKKNALIGTITSENGLDNAQILSLAVGYDGTLYAGTDGAGLYAINNNVIEKQINTETGLSSDIVMRTIPYDRGMIIVVSNGIYFLTDDALTKIDSFPYFNNFDVIIIENQAYIVSSAGVFVLDVNDLVTNSISSYDLFGTADGLNAGLVSNSWNYYGKDKRLYLCTNAGVMAFDKAQSSEKQWYKFGIEKIVADGIVLEAKGDKFVAPKGVKNIVIYPSVRSYELGDIMVRFYVEGLESEADLVSFKQLKEKYLSWVSSGQYVIHMQLYSRDSKVMLQEKSYILTKEKELWETTEYIVYIILVMADLLFMFTFTIVHTVNRRQAEKERAALRKANEEELTRQIEKAKQDLKRNEKENQKQLKHQLEQTISALAKTVDAKDAYTNGHSSRVAKYAKEIARRFGNGWNTEESQNIIGQAGLLHDVGKIKIPDAIINKPGKLNDAEYDTIKTHSEWGYAILKEIDALPELARAARYHHERYDGKGYPAGLKGEQIPIMARIIAVADSYDAMTSNRSYRRLLPQDVVRDEIVKGKGTQFDPVFADIMVKMIDEDTDYRMNEDRDKEDGINYDEPWN